MIEEFWSGFVAATGIAGPYTAWAFGDPSAMPALSTELALLVRDGPKRATAGLLAEYEAEAEPLPQVGELSVILDGAGTPICVIRTSASGNRAISSRLPPSAWMYSPSLLSSTRV